MTELSAEPVAPPAATPPPPEPIAPQPPPAAPTVAPDLAHTPGGIPVLPLALSGTNSAVGAIGAAALVGGGPLALAVAVAAGSAAVLGTSAALRARRLNSVAGRGSRRSAGSNRQGGTRRTPRSPASRSGGSSGLFSGSRGRGTGAKSRTGGGTSGSGLRSGGGAGRHGGRHASGLGAKRNGTGQQSAGRAGQVRALRQNNRAQTPTRSAARQQTTAARRAVADARRDARAATRDAKSAASRGRLGRAGGWAAGKAASGSRALVNKARALRDRNTAGQVNAKRGQVRKAPARRKARMGLLKSAARFQGRRALAALVGGAAGVLGCLTTPLGRKLGARWLMHPGRRLYQRLVQAAREKRAARDEQIRATRTAEEAAADAAGPGEIGDRVQRPAHLIPAVPGLEAIHVSGFKFEEAAAEMENAARTYAPDGNMEILTMIDNLPTALLSIANTFRILAERSDEEFAFEKDVAAGFDDIHRTLLNAVDSGETLVPLFRDVHAQDIARHEDPRNGSEAEKGWNV